MILNQCQWYFATKTCSEVIERLINALLQSTEDTIQQFVPQHSGTNPLYELMYHLQTTAKLLHQVEWIHIVDQITKEKSQLF
jgi:hypothetical protein